MDVPQISYEPIFPVKMAIVCSPKLLPKGESDRKLARLKSVVREIGFIGSMRTDYRAHPSKSLMDLIGRDPVVAFEANSQEAQKRLCLDGAGVAYLARFMVEKELASGALVEILPGKPRVLDLLLAKRKGRPLSLNARTFLDLVKQKA